MNGILIAHRGSVRIEKDELMKIEAPEPTKSWRLIQHGVLVNTPTEVLSSRGIEARKEEHAGAREGNIKET